MVCSSIQSLNNQVIEVEYRHARDGSDRHADRNPADRIRVVGQPDDAREHARGDQHRNLDAERLSHFNRFVSEWLQRNVMASTILWYTDVLL